MEIRLHPEEARLLVALSMRARIELKIEAYGPFCELEERGLTEYVTNCDGHTLRMEGRNRGVALTGLGRALADAVIRGINTISFKPESGEQQTVDIMIG